VRPDLRAEDCAVLVALNVKVRMEAKNSITLLSLHNLLRENFASSSLVRPELFVNKCERRIFKGVIGRQHILGVVRVTIGGEILGLMYHYVRG